MDVVHGRRPSARRWAAPARGFTLIELMVAISVVAIAASIAIPTYKNYVIRGKVTQAFSQLSGWAIGMQQQYQDDRSYSNGCGATGAGATPNVNTGDFTYNCAKTATTFTLSAVGKTGSTVASLTYTVDQTGARATTVAGGGLPTSPSCWVISSSGTCY